MRWLRGALVPARGPAMAGPIWVMALVVAGTAVPAPAQEVPSADWRVEAFRTTCLPDRQDYEAMRKRALAEGWQETADDAHPDLAVIMSVSRAVDLDPGMTAGFTAYQRRFDDSDAFLVVSYLTSEMIDLVSCYLYDFAAASPIAQSAVDPLMGEPPYQVLEEPSPIVGQQWDTPAALPGAWDAQNGFIPADGPGAALAGFSGVLLRITAVDPKDGG